MREEKTYLNLFEVNTAVRLYAYKVHDVLARIM